MDGAIGHLTYFVALGANLPSRRGSPAETLRWALRELGAGGNEVRAVSRFLRNPAEPPSGQPDFVNAVAAILGPLDPPAMLAQLHALERAAGRVRGLPNAARTLDLDLLAAGELVLETPALTLPHPRLHLRRFVLGPLVEIAPGWRHPLLGRTAAELMAGLGAGDGRR